MPTRSLALLLDRWERELQMVIETGPTHDEFWSYWTERETAAERAVTPDNEAKFESGLERLFAIAERHGYLRTPRPVAEDDPPRDDSPAPCTSGDPANASSAWSLPETRP